MFRPLPRACALAALAFCAAASAAPSSTPIEILFVGDSYTFGRVDPVMSYNAANVHDLTAAFNAADSSGTNAFEPHPWGGVPGIFKEFTDRGRAELRRVDLRAQRGLAARPVPRHRQRRVGPARQRRVAELERGRAAGPERRRRCPPARARTPTTRSSRPTSNQFVNFIHNGAAQTYTETQLYGSLAACEATGAVEDLVRHQARDPRQHQRERRHQGLPDRDLGAPGHGVRAQDHHARPDLAQRRAHRRHQRHRRPRRRSTTRAWAR